MNFTCAFTTYCIIAQDNPQNNKGNRETTMRYSSDTRVPMSPKYLVVVTQVPWCDNSNTWWLHLYPSIATITRGSSTGTHSLVSLQYFVAPMVHKGTNGADTIYSSDTKLAEEQPRDTVVTIRNPWSQQGDTVLTLG